MTIPHNKPVVGTEEIKAVIYALSNLKLTLGTKIKEFVRAFYEFIWINSAATSSGTSALHLALVEAGGILMLNENSFTYEVRRGGRIGTTILAEVAL